MNGESTAKQVVSAFWAAMSANDFPAAGRWLHDDYVLVYPQSGERIRGRANFVAVNANYPAAGRWQITLQQLLAEGNEVASHVTVTDGVVHAQAITFSTVSGGLILSQTEYWPDPFPPAAWRKQWVEQVGTQ